MDLSCLVYVDLCTDLWPTFALAIQNKACASLDSGLVIKVGFIVVFHVNVFLTNMYYVGNLDNWMLHLVLVNQWRLNKGQTTSYLSFINRCCLEVNQSESDYLAFETEVVEL